MSRRWPKGNVGKQSNTATGGHAGDGHANGGCCESNDKPRPHDTSRIAWAKLMARVGEKLPIECPACGRDIRLIAFITEPGPIRKILAHLAEPLISRPMLKDEPLAGLSVLHTQSSQITPLHPPRLTGRNPPLRLLHR
ncbi:MAG: hypothetical protein NTY25_00295 [Planctomycetia bacterium]|nr:hypothetical protein [Planctomycetia bacterium]